MTLWTERQHLTIVAPTIKLEYTKFYTSTQNPRVAILKLQMDVLEVSLPYILNGLHNLCNCNRGKDFLLPIFLMYAK